jgi:hypothetical protein
LLFVQGVYKDFDVTEEVASVHSTHGPAAGEDTFKQLEQSFI